MPSPFVWFDNISTERDKTTAFLTNSFDWTPNNIGPMTFLTQGGDQPFAATCDAMEGVSGWVPYIEVDRLEEAVTKAMENGATLIAENLQGPAGVATFLKDPGGAPLALWKRAEGL